MVSAWRSAMAFAARISIHCEAPPHSIQTRADRVSGDGRPGAQIFGSVQSHFISRCDVTENFRKTANRAAGFHRDLFGATIANAEDIVLLHVASDRGLRNEQR